MSHANSYQYDLFISYARDDLAWVHGYLLPSLGLPPDRVLTEQGFAHGMALAAEFEEAIQNSRLTLLVYSPAFPANEWTDFSERLATHLAVETQRERIALLLLEPCAIPLYLQPRLKLDCTDASRWQRAVADLLAFLELPEPDPEDIPCPYPGMSPFGATDAQRFFGRDEEIYELCRRIDQNPLTLIVGPSGSGKSSLLAAGLIPALPAGWRHVLVRPGQQPFDALRAALAEVEGAAEYLDRASPVPAQLGKHLLLIVDQLEELFVQADGATKASHDEQVVGFVDAINRLQQCASWAVVLALRADFFSDLMNSRMWPIAPEQRLEITPLRGEQLRPVIQRPAHNLKVYLEAGLVERLIADAADEPGVLPLLQQAMVLLWERRQRRLLSLSAYEAMGEGQRSGLATAVAKRADEAMQALPDEDQPIVPRILVRLVAFGEGRVDTRRQQTISTVVNVTADHEHSLHVIRHLAHYRLLTLGEKDGEQQTVDIAHDVLITGWPAFGEWLRAYRAAELTRRRLETKAEEWTRWAAAGQPGSGLLDAGELAEAEQWLASEDALQLGYSPVLQTLVHKSRADHKHSRRIRVGVISSLLVLVIAVLAAIAFGQTQLAAQRSQAAATAISLAEAEVRARSTAESEVVVRTTAEARAVAEAAARATAQAVAEQESNAAVARQLAAHAQAIKSTSGQLDTAVLLAVESMRRDTNPEASLFLQQTLDQLLPPLLDLNFTSTISEAVFSPSADMIAVSTADQKLSVFELPEGRQVAELLPEKPIERIAFCHNSTQLLVVETGVVELWVPTNSRPLQRIALSEPYSTVLYDPACQWLVIDHTADGNQRLEFWNLQRGAQIRAVTSASSYTPLALAPDGEWLLRVSELTMELWRVQDARMVTKFNVLTNVREIVFNTNGSLAVLNHDCDYAGASDQCQSISVVDLDTQRVMTQFGRPGGNYAGAIFANDDSYLIGMAGQTLIIDPREVNLYGSTGPQVPDDKIIVWQTDTWKPVSEQDAPSDNIVPHPKQPLAASFSQDIVTIWDIERGNMISQFDVGRDVDKVSWIESDVFRWVLTIPAWRPCPGERCVFSLEIWDARTGTPIAQLSAPESGNPDYAVDPAGRYALGWNISGKRLVLWGLTPRKYVALDTGARVLDLNNPVHNTRFSTDSRWVVTSRSRGDLSVWRLPDKAGTDGKPWLPTMEINDVIGEFVISPDSRWIATRSTSLLNIEIRTLDNGQSVFVVPLNGTPLGFTPDRTQLIASDQKDGQNTVVVWNLNDAREQIRIDIPPLDSYKQLNEAGTRFAVDELSTDLGGLSKLHVYDLHTGELIFHLPVQYWTMNSAGTLLLLAGPDGRPTLELWSIDQNAQLAAIDLDNPTAIKLLAFNAHSEAFIAADTFSIRSLPDLAEKASWSLGDVMFPHLSADGRWVIASKGMSNAYVIDAHTGKPVARLWVPGRAALKVAWTQADEPIMVIGDTGQQRVLIWKPESLIAEACNRLTRNLTEWEWSMYLPNEPYRKTCSELL